MADPESWSHVRVGGQGTDRITHRRAGPAETSEVVSNIAETTAYPPEILCVGMVNHNKGQLELIGLLDYFNKHLADFRIVYAGRGNLLNKILEIAEKKGMRDRVLAPGLLSHEERRGRGATSHRLPPRGFGR